MQNRNYSLPPSVLTAIIMKNIQFLGFPPLLLVDSDDSVKQLLNQLFALFIQKLYYMSVYYCYVLDDISYINKYGIIWLRRSLFLVGTTHFLLICFNTRIHPSRLQIMAILATLFFVFMQEV